MLRLIKRLNLALSAISLLLTACTSVDPAASPLPTPDVNFPTDYQALAGTAMIGLQRSGCFGFCPAYDLAIYGDGWVIYRGHGNVDVRGVRVAKIPSSSVHLLLEEFDKLGFFTLADRYSQGMTDIPTFTITLVIGSQRKQVEHYGCPPQELIDLEYLIDETVNSAHWVGQNAYTNRPRLRCADYEWVQPYSPLRP